MIQPEQIFKDYDQVKKCVNDLVVKNDTKKIDKLVEDFCKYLFENKPKYTIKEIKNVANFLIDVPISSRYVFVEVVDKHKMNTDNKLIVMISEGYEYIGCMHKRLMRNFKNYKINFFDKIMEYIERKGDSIDNR